MGSVTLEIVFIVLLIVANGLFAMAEIAVISSRKARLARRAGSGVRGAAAALELARTPEHFLSTVQVGITLVGILAGAFGGATVAESLSGLLGGVPALAPYRHPLALGVVVASITYLSLIVGELVPKRLALLDPERVAAAVAGPMRLLTRLAHPVVHFLSASTALVLRALGVRASAEAPVTHEEVRILIEQGARAGVFEPTEHDIVDRVLRLGNRRVAALMTPRTDIEWIDARRAPEEIARQAAESRHSRFPVADATLDNVIGFVRARDLLPQLLAGGRVDVRGVLRDPLYIPESMEALDALERFKRASERVALVVDEHGGIAGLVTDHDVFEAVLGEVSSAGRLAADDDVVERDDGSWLIGGMLSVDEFKNVLKVPKLPGEERGEVHTMGGFVMQHMGRIPSAGEHFETAGLRFEVVDMDGRRVDKLLVSRVPAPPEPLDA